MSRDPMDRAGLQENAHSHKGFTSNVGRTQRHQTKMGLGFRTWSERGKADTILGAFRTSFPVHL